MVKICSRELLSIGKVDHFSTGRSSTNNAYKSLRFKIYGSHHNLAAYQLGIMRLKNRTRSSVSSLAICCYFSLAVILAIPIRGETNRKSKKVSEPNQETLFNFKSEKSGDDWIVVNDNVMGGRSEGGFNIKKKRLLFSGSTNTNGGGFSSIRTKPKSLGLANKDGIVLRYKGDGRTYKFGVRMEKSSVSYRADFKTSKDGKGWEIAKIPFSSLQPSWRGVKLSLSRYPLDKDKIQSIGVMIYDKKDGPFQLHIDWINTYVDHDLK